MLSLMSWLVQTEQVTQRWEGEWSLGSGWEQLAIEVVVIANFDYFQTRTFI
jgi:hypothetical protein